jgi:hypothetical protein
MSNICNLPAHVEDDGFDLVGTPTEQSFRASQLKFKKGLFSRDAAPVPPGTCYTAIAAMVVWLRLMRDEKPQEIVRAPGKPFPRREELPDQDQSRWVPFDGQRSDPWRLESRLLLADTVSGDPVVFATSSVTGRTAVEDLCRVISFQRRTRGPRAKPVIELGVTTRDLKFGPVAIPTFKIVNWVDETAEPGPAAASPLQAQVIEQLGQRSAIDAAATPAARKPKKAPPPWADDALDDEINI